MMLIAIPGWLKKLFAGWIWQMPVTKNTVFLTFDDGPTPEVTPMVLAFLYKYQGKATFFCTGKKAEKQAGILQEIIKNGHQLGNHGYHHLDGFNLKARKHFENMMHGKRITGSSLYRPPYGHLWPWQSTLLKKESKIVMWTIMSYDFDNTLAPDECLHNITQHIKPGSIIVFHDTEKAWPTLSIVLPKLLEWLSLNEYCTDIIPG
jgi:peptidoglycan/xylan/chitin deacetylase (PgdA/CDA1 family)